MSFVLDASVALAWCFDDEGGEYPTHALQALRTTDAMVASHWTLEVANGLLAAERRGRIGAAEVARVGSLLLSLPIAVDPVERSRGLTVIHRLARTRGLSTYDAAYLELAMRMGMPIATLDGDLRRAAAEEGVALFSRSESSLGGAEGGSRASDTGGSLEGEALSLDGHPDHIM